jgi:hypothetical protein
MKGGKMDLPLNAKVFGRDGYIGRITYVVVDPRREIITHLVVQLAELFGEEVIVPIEKVSESNPHSIILSCSCETAAHLKPFVEAELISNLPFLGYASGSMVTSPMDIPVILHKQVPPGERPIQWGVRVRARDGTCGKVEEFQIEPGSGQITCVVLRKGHFWEHPTDVFVPAVYIDNLDEDRIDLTADRKTIDAMPAIPV